MGVKSSKSGTVQPPTIRTHLAPGKSMHMTAILFYLCFATAGAGNNSGWDFKELDMNQTPAENGVTEESDLYESLDMPHDSFIPVLHLHWNDDLTVA